MDCAAKKALHCRHCGATCAPWPRPSLAFTIASAAPLPAPAPFLPSDGVRLWGGPVGGAPSRRAPPPFRRGRASPLSPSATGLDRSFDGRRVRVPSPCPVAVSAGPCPGRWCPLAGALLLVNAPWSVFFCSCFGCCPWLRLLLPGRVVFLGGCLGLHEAQGSRVLPIVMIARRAPF